MTESVEGCIDPAAISRDELAALALGEGLPRAADHVARCSACRREVAAYAAPANVLRSALFRRSCPPSETLGEYALGLLDGTSRMSVAEHLLDCLWCKAEVEGLSRFVARPDEAEPAGLASSLRRLLARPVQPTPSLVLRGDADSDTTIYAVEDIRITAGIQAPSPGQAGKVIAGLVQLDDAPVTSGTVRLYEEEREIASETLDEFGNFFFTRIGPGEYRLVVSAGQDIVTVDAVQVT